MKRQIDTRKEVKQLSLEDFERPGVTRAMVASMKRCFDLLDADEEGLVDLCEIRSMIRGLNLAPRFPACAAAVLDSLQDKEEQRKVGFQEFMQVFGLGPGQRLSLQEVWDQFDPSGQGSLGPEELRAACRRAQSRYSQRQLGEMLQTLDRDKDGAVSRQEFIRYFSNRS